MCQCDTIGAACPDPECQKRYAQIGMLPEQSVGRMGDPACRNCGGHLVLYRYYTGLECWDIIEAESPGKGYLWVRVTDDANSDEMMEEIRTVVGCDSCRKEIGVGMEIEIQYG